MTAVLEGEALREVDDARLRRPVRGVVGRAGHAAHRPDVHDRAAAALVEHDLDDLARHEEHVAEVHADDEVPLLVGPLVRRLPRRERVLTTDDRDEDVDAAELLDGRPHDARHLGGFADVGGDGDGSRARGRELARDPFGALGLQVDDRDAGTRRAECQRHRPADAAPAADDECGLAGQESG